MPTNLVYENKNGAYENPLLFLFDEFVIKESNSNFDVFDSKDESKRLIFARCSRLADDEDLMKGRYGIDFYRGKPTCEEALSYAENLPSALKNREEYTGNFAFAAKSKEEYERKARIWEEFYSYIFDFRPMTIYVTPHSGSITREPDDIIPDPVDELDSWAAGVASLCAIKDKRRQKRIMISVHSSGYLGAVIDLGSLGILDEEKLKLVASEVEKKYYERVHPLAPEYKSNFFTRVMKKLQATQEKRGTLNPEELQTISTDDKFYVDNTIKWLARYGEHIEQHTLDEYETKISNTLNKSDVEVLTVDSVFSGKRPARLLKLEEKIKDGLLNSAIQIECSKFYSEREPELMSDIILDVFERYF
ncbi:MAG: hypothetical protein QMD14_04865 [Candidatus Aenigmarchaeota archaeon]|nr:hypothetical protein [Candidatus Aenigmarchaeota archaeon]